ncbi:hypothetical protein OKA05_18650 [Luteolibacter arcticus]|uniref:DUF4340 domain-containing protein n=1 Tax=Luteolibacter arcticus TaxID=1581411 RepID=A0ABT3GM88_9BACT|nr:hypothetical protein [Luteolibacter arcticus]MCW1924591.1 hypothetical protein [Luteolibacter arcticus]
MKWRRLLATCVLCLGQGMAEPEVITGVRTWHMADGKSRRLKLLQLSPDGKFAYFHDGKAKGKIPPVSIDALVPEERQVLERLHSGAVVLCKVPDLSMLPDMPVGKAAELIPQLRAGDTRQWHHANGKVIEARLVNLTDDDVSLLAGESISRVALGDLSEADLKYLDGLKKGDSAVAGVAPIEVFRHGWEENPSYSVSLTPARHASLVQRGSGFEAALDASLKAATAKMPPGSWQFLSLEEHPASRNPEAAADAKVPLLYQATFALETAGYRAARTAWPLTVTPENWQGPPELILHVTADGEILTAKPANP